MDYISIQHNPCWPYHFNCIIGMIKLELFGYKIWANIIWYLPREFYFRVKGLSTTDYVWTIQIGPNKLNLFKLTRNIYILHKNISEYMPCIPFLLCWLPHIDFAIQLDMKNFFCRFYIFPGFDIRPLIRFRMSSISNSLRL